MFIINDSEVVDCRHERAFVLPSVSFKLKRKSELSLQKIYNTIYNPNLWYQCITVIWMETYLTQRKSTSAKLTPACEIDEPYGSFSIYDTPKYNTLNETHIKKIKFY